MTRTTQRLGLAVLVLALLGVQPASARDTNEVADPHFLAPFDAFGGTVEAPSDGAASMSYDGTLAVARVTAAGALEAQLRLPGSDPGPVTTLQAAYGRGVVPSHVQVVAARSSYAQSRAEAPIAVVWDSGAGAWFYSFATGTGWTHAHSLGADRVYDHGVSIGGGGRLWVAQQHGSGPSGATHVTMVSRRGQPHTITVPKAPVAADEDVALGVIEGTETAEVVVVRSVASQVGADGTPCGVRTRLAALTLRGDGTSSAITPHDPQDATGTVTSGTCELTGGTTLSTPQIVTQYTEALATFEVSSVVGAPDPSVRSVYYDRDNDQWHHPSHLMAAGTPSALFQGDFDYVQVIATTDDAGVPQLGYVAKRIFGDDDPEPLVALTGPSGGTGAFGAGSFEGGLLAWSEAAAPFRVQYRAFDQDDENVGVQTTDSAGSVLGVGGDMVGDGAVLTTGLGASTQQVLPLDAAGPDLAFPDRPDRKLSWLLVFPHADAGVSKKWRIKPLDLWSASKPAVWHFGDGPAVVGDEVDHVFRKEGYYSISVEATDALGNTTEEYGSARVTDDVAPVIKQLRLVRDSAGSRYVRYRAQGLYQIEFVAVGEDDKPIYLTTSLDLPPPNNEVADVSLPRLKPGRYRIFCRFYDVGRNLSRGVLHLRVPPRS